MTNNRRRMTGVVTAKNSPALVRAFPSVFRIERQIIIPEPSACILAYRRLWRVVVKKFLQEIPCIYLCLEDISLIE